MKIGNINALPKVMRGEAKSQYKISSLLQPLLAQTCCECILLRSFTRVDRMKAASSCSSYVRVFQCSPISSQDKEKSMNAIDELLSSDVTPESIAEWRAKYEIVTGAHSSELNENSQV